MTIEGRNIEKFFLQGKRFYYKKNEVITRSEDEPQGIYFVEKGFIKMNSVFEDGKILTVNIFKPGTFFPMMWALADIPNRYSYEALTNSSLLMIEKDKALKFIHENPDVLLDLTRRIMTGLDRLIKNMEKIIRGQAPERVMATLILCSRRFGVLKNGKLTIKLPLTHQDIADMSALSRETTTLTLNKFKKEKLISYKYRNIIIENIKRFQLETEYKIQS